MKFLPWLTGLTMAVAMQATEPNSTYQEFVLIFWVGWLVGWAAGRDLREPRRHD